jgi:hypothetical protein
MRAPVGLDKIIARQASGTFNSIETNRPSSGNSTTTKGDTLKGAPPSRAASPSPSQISPTQDTVKGSRGYVWPKYK